MCTYIASDAVLSPYHACGRYIIIIIYVHSLHYILELYSYVNLLFVYMIIDDSSINHKLSEGKSKHYTSYFKFLNVLIENTTVKAYYTRASVKSKGIVNTFIDTMSHNCTYIYAIELPVSDTHLHVSKRSHTKRSGKSKGL